MIKINLSSAKKRRSLFKGKRFPFEVLLLLLGFAGIVAAYQFGAEMIKDRNEPKKQEEARLKRENETQQYKLHERDTLKQKVQRTKSDIDRFKRLSGMGLLQWSQVFANLADVVPSDNVWITSLRIDADRRVQISAYACNDKGAKTSEYEARLTKGIQNFIDALQRHEHFKDVFLQSASKNQYEQTAVWRFELHCRITKELTEK